ncbi:GntR family transcriptional regulator [Pseudomonas azerbaijanoccidentalis]
MNSFASQQYSRETLTALPFANDRGEKLTAEDLYPRVFDAILDLRITASSRITEENLGRMFGASRSNVRRVLTRLSHEQVVLLRTNHRPHVTAPTCEQIRQVLHARRLTETTIIHLVCQQRRTGALQVLRGLIDEHRQLLECGQRGPALRLCGEFHLQLANLAGNAPLANFLSGLIPQTSLAMAQNPAAIENDGYWRRHLAIVDALDQTKTSTAVKLMIQHLDDLGQRLVKAHQQ